jgi:hypothetical protein
MRNCVRGPGAAAVQNENLRMLVGCRICEIVLTARRFGAQIGKAEEVT